MKNPTDNTLRHLLFHTKTIAIIGAKDNPDQSVNHVGQYLLEVGYTVIPVHPVRKSVWGIPCYPSIIDIPIPIDIVNLFRAAAFCPAHAHETVSLLIPPKAFWMQKGIHSPEAVAIIQKAGMIAIENLCIMVEHKRLLGSLL